VSQLRPRHLISVKFFYKQILPKCLRGCDVIRWYLLRKLNSTSKKKALGEESFFYL
jgi:hypothetical protein